jgi:hypothetical protein
MNEESGVLTIVMAIRFNLNGILTRTWIGEERSLAKNHDWISDAIFETRFDAESARGNCKLINLSVAAGEAIRFQQVSKSKLADIPDRGSTNAGDGEIACAKPGVARLRRITFANYSKVKGRS